MPNLKTSLITGYLLVLFTVAYGQGTEQDSVYRLQKALNSIENRFKIHLDYPDSLVAGLRIENQDWLNKESVEISLLHLLSSHQLMFLKSGNGRFQISAFNTHRRSDEEGSAQLKFLSQRYNGRESWEKRKKVLRTCMLDALRLSSLPSRPNTDPIISHTRTMKGYVIKNIAIETLPGLFVTGSLYQPESTEGLKPVILSPNGHFNGGRYRPDQQYRMATLARMGAIVFSYDLFGWGESQLQFDHEDHRTEMAMTIQILNGIRILDYLTNLKDADPGRVGITGGSGGGSQTMLLAALDDRISVSVPVVMLSSYFNGGCPCESGRPVHLCGGGTNNVEIAAMAAPNPQLIISDGNDWTAHVPELAYPHVRKIYSYYGAESLVVNVHLPDEGHDYGISKRLVMYEFMARHLELDKGAIIDERGNIDESVVTIEEEAALYVFGKNGNSLPDYAVKSIEALEEFF